jgi:dephospho-CoA kinase
MLTIAPRNGSKNSLRLRIAYNRRIVFAGKPVIGIVGGIGSGKSFVAQLFAELGCLVISSDEQVTAAYRDPRVLATLHWWWGEDVIAADGSLNRRAVAQRVFADPQQRKRLEELIHPLVNAARQRAMDAAKDDPEVTAFVWDTPLLLETGLNKQCDAVVFVEAPEPSRQARVRENRGWEGGELARREKSQWPLDRKREISDYVISNTADAGFARGQVSDVLSRILARITPKQP